MTADISGMDIDALEGHIAASWGDRVYRRRIELGLSQTQLASLVGVSQRTISHIECGDILPREGLKVALTRRLNMQRVSQLFPHPDRLGGGNDSQVFPHPDQVAS